MFNFNILIFIIFTCQFGLYLNGANRPVIRPDDVSPKCHDELDKNSNELDLCYDSAKAEAREELEGLDVSHQDKVSAAVCKAINTTQDCYEVVKVYITASYCIIRITLFEKIS